MVVAPCTFCAPRRFTAAFLGATAFRVARFGAACALAVLALLFRTARFAVGFAAVVGAATAGFALFTAGFGVATFIAASALAFLTAAHRFRTAAMIRGRSSGNDPDNR